MNKPNLSIQRLLQLVTLCPEDYNAQVTVRRTLPKKKNHTHTRSSLDMHNLVFLSYFIAIITTCLAHVLVAIVPPPQ